MSIVVRITNEQEMARHCSRLKEYAAQNGATVRSTTPAAIAAAACAVMAPNSPAHQGMLAAGTAVGMSEKMVREAINNHFSQMKVEALQHLQQEHCGTGTFDRTPLVFHILAGNLFLSAIDSITQAALAGACSLVRCSSADQRFPVVWADAIAAADPCVGKSIEVCYWPSNEESLTLAAAQAADVVVAFGSDVSIHSIRGLVPGSSKFVPYGNRVSFAIVAAEDLRNTPLETARALAYDFSVYDQQGCLSPRAAFIEHSSPDTLLKFTKHFAEQMRILTRQLPPGGLALSERAALARHRDEALINMAVDGSTRLVSDMADSYVAVVGPIENFNLGCLNRFADLRIFSTYEELDSCLRPYYSSIAVIAHTEGNAGSIKKLAAGLGVGRTCRVGEMQKPPLGWSHDGRPLLAELV